MNYNFKKDFSKHGGNIYSLGKKQNSIIDFSANISPLGLPVAVKDEIIKCLDICDKYPDVDCTKLRDKLGEYYNLPKEYFYVGNGAGDIIFRFAKGINIKKALILAPTFSEYSLACGLENAKIENYILKEENNFEINEDIIGYINKDIDAVFICNPNNPTGKLTNKKLLIKILDRCKQVNSFLFLDECFLDFTGNEAEFSCLELTKKYENLIILKAFTKIYAMAGLRLGYCVTSNKNLIDNLKNCGQPWNVSTVAQVAGVSALEQEKYKNDVINLIKNEREFLSSGLKKIGFKVFSSSVNYIFFKNVINQLDLKAELLKMDILIRSCENYIGLDKNFYRVAVKNHMDNEKLLDCMRKVVNG